MTSSQRTVLRGGSVIDGTGASARAADVVVDNGKIEAVAAPGTASGLVVDCTGSVIAPGFVDLHTHSDLSLLKYPGNESRITQGITTEVVGNCGMTPAPTGGDPTGLADVVSTINVVPDLSWDWREVGAWLDALGGARVATDTLALVGHGSARFAVTGASSAPLSAGQADTLERELESAIDAGCVGVSLGLMYAPGQGATVEELDRVGRVAARRGVLLAAHLRDYTGDALLDSVREVLGVARRTEARLQISHLRAVSGGDFQRVLSEIDDARGEVDVTADVYPYIAGHTTALQLLPPSIRGRSVTAIAQWCAGDPAEAAAALRTSGFDPDGVTVMKANVTPEAVGHSVAELDPDNPWRALASLVADNLGRVDVAVVGSTWADVDHALRQPWICIASDGTALSRAHRATRPHPRSWATFPQAWRRMMSLGVRAEDAIRRMTDMPAGRIGHSATITRGAPASIVVFDPDTFNSDADYVTPDMPADGVKHVYVHGEAVVANGVTTSRRPGQLIRRKAQ